MKVNVREITVTIAAPCLTCEARVQQGARAWWAQGIGVWHKDCARPRNLEVYQRELERKRQLGTMG